MSYAEAHARANALVARKGASVTFTSGTATYDATSDQFTSPSSSTVAGSAVRVRGNPKQYEALSIVQREPLTLVFTPTTYGGLPALGSVVTWNSQTYTVVNVSPTAPDGTAIAARIVVAK